MPKPPAPAPKKYRTVKAPSPGSRIKFVGRAGRGLTQEQLDKMLGPDGQMLPGAPENIGEEGIWGSDGADVSGYGTVQSATLRRTAEREKYPDNNGETTGYVFFDFADAGEAELLVPSGYSAVDPGDTFSIGGKTLYVLSATLRWQHRGWASYNVQCEKHDTVSVS
jgi:hypothetical protein